MLGLRARLGGLAIAAAASALGDGSTVTTSGPWRRTRNRRDWLKYRATKRGFDPRKRTAKRKAQRRARRAERMGRK